MTLALVLFSLLGSPIAIQGAVDTELAPLVEALGNPEPRDIQGFRFWEGTVGGQPIVVSRTEVGMVHAAMATMILVREYHPSVIINQGTAGAADPALDVGDIVLSTASVPFGSIRTAPRRRGKGVDLGGWELLPRLLREGGKRVRVERFEADPEVLAVAKKLPYEGGRLVPGIVGSGDQWNREIDKLLWAHERLGIASEDMESAAVHQVAHIFGVPFFAVRIISNSEYHDAAFRPELGAVSAGFALALATALAP